MYPKHLLTRELLAREAIHNARKSRPFDAFHKRLREDYRIPETLDIKELRKQYNTLLFIVGERKVKFNRVG